MTVAAFTLAFGAACASAPRSPAGSAAAPDTPLTTAPMQATAPAAAQTTAQSSAQVASLGDTASYPVRIAGIGYGPLSRVAIVLGQAAYVTVVSVTPTRITALVPGTGHESRILDAGIQAISFGGDSGPPRAPAAGFGQPAPVDNQGSAAAQMEYDRCIAAARAANAARAKTRRRHVGVDKLGNPIYEEVRVEDMDYRLDYERRCHMPEVNGAARGAPAPVVARYLLVFASDTPVSNQDIIDLTVSAGDMRLTAMVIGTRLFAVRGAKWSAAYVPW